MTFMQTDTPETIARGIVQTTTHGEITDLVLLLRDGALACSMLADELGERAAVDAADPHAIDGHRARAADFRTLADAIERVEQTEDGDG